MNLHHEVVDVHGSGSLLTEISLLQNTFNLLADTEVWRHFLKGHNRILDCSRSVKPIYALVLLLSYYSVIPKWDVHRRHYCAIAATFVGRAGGGSDSPHCVRSSGSCSSSPAAVPLQTTCRLRMKQTKWNKRHGLQWLISIQSGHSLESSTEGFVLPHEGYSDQAVPFLPGVQKQTMHQERPSDHPHSHKQSSFFKPHLEVDWRRRIFGFDSHHARLDFGRRTEIIFSNLV